MRGVYYHEIAHEIADQGSSPHARGLPQPSAGGSAAAGIIPACAGFTVQHRTGRRRTADHPRMRGVYPSLLSTPILGSGSSPHARGLRPRVAARTLAARIIPACAGFTMLLIVIGCVSEDHPRMRGVYGEDGEAREVAYGSSPHARGLPTSLWCPSRTQRIIPACAGFTWNEHYDIEVYSDHPRMRGVYGS